MRTIQALLTTVILFSIHQAASAQTRGAIAIEDCVAFESSLSALSPSNKRLKIKAGEIFALDKKHSVTRELWASDIGQPFVSKTEDGLRKTIYFSNPTRADVGTTAGVAAWVPEKSIQVFDAGKIDDPFESYTASISSYGRPNVKARWKDEFVAKAKMAAPEAVQAKMRWADPFVKRFEERESRLAAVRQAAQPKTAPAKPAPLTGGPGMYLINEESKVWKNGTSQIIRDRNGLDGFITNIFVTEADLYVTGGVGVIPDAYTIGNPLGKAAYWKNGELHQLEEIVASTATAIYVSDGDVYVAGVRGADTAMRPVLWINGKVQDLSEKRGDDAWIPSGIYVKGSDITVVGATAPFSRSFLTTRTGKLYAWKNGVETEPMKNLKVPATNTRVRQTGGMRDIKALQMYIRVSNGDVYFGGWEGEEWGKPHTLRAWKNAQPIARATVETNLPSFADVSFYASENNVIFYTDTHLWKNGTQIKLGTIEDPTTLEQLPHKIHSVCASGEDVYAIGKISDRPALWKNGKASLSKNADQSFAARALIVKD